ncbi:DUF2716 domain-containing protein [Amycolatopsis rhabdoformis]|uniref:DUF2716 domain-containing protein n=1 Tax=Amycolatopsis rhabdoformis TaxID=1448059 RepID=A0ABZ1ICN3_9PSEU|nr:DUF2716 domain-containing protein [Amycolatopsis rhabdoformis]WSE31888.1 DUF2716 domain-containing protein [Amycolatopsis rhabdoformis]
MSPCRTRGSSWTGNCNANTTRCTRRSSTARTASRTSPTSTTGNIDDWEYSHYPNGDYVVFVSKDLSFGIVGNHHERSLCFFGEPAVSAATRLNRGILGPLLRRDGISVRTGT